MKDITIDRTRTLEALKSLTIDRDQARQFISRLGSVTSPETYQVFDDRGQNQKLARHVVGTFSQRAQTLLDANRKGCGVFITINQCDGTGRKAENVTRVRAVFADFDGTPWDAAAAALQPHIIVETSPGKRHLYWLVADFPLKEFKPIQQAIAKRYGSDPSICDLARVMRLPGYWHVKGEPHLVRIVESDEHDPYTYDEIVTALLGGKVNLTSTIPRPNLEDTSTIPHLSPHEYIDADGVCHDLKRWGRYHGTTIDLVGTITAHAPHILRGEPVDGKQHIQCPFAAQHTDPDRDDYSTFVANDGGGKTKGFAIKCLHAHCTGRDRLDFVREMLGLGWLPQSILAAKQEVMRPLWVNFPRSINQESTWIMLSHDERRIALDLLRVAWTLEDGTLPDDDYILSRHLGLSEQEWAAYRDTLTRTGWLRSGGGRCWNQLLLDEYDKAAVSYTAKVAGGSKRKDKDTG